MFKEDDTSNEEGLVAHFNGIISSDGTVVDMPAYKLQIRGGSDSDGVPMRPNVHGGGRRKIILSGGVGFAPKNKGERRRKTVRGDIITEEITQIKTKIVEEPKKTVASKIK